MARIHQRATGGRLPPDVVLMDLRMPEVDGVEATARIRTEHPDVRVVVLTTYADDESVFAALRAGARGYLTKDAGSEEIARAIALVAAGEAMLDPAVQVRLLDRFDAAAAFEPPAFSAADVAGLTAREVEVLTLIARGLSNAEIAEHLVVGESTVTTHVNRIFAKTGVRDRAQVVAYAYRAGLVRPDLHPWVDRTLTPIGGRQQTHARVTLSGCAPQQPPTRACLKMKASGCEVELSRNRFTDRRPSCPTLTLL